VFALCCVYIEIQVFMWCFVFTWNWNFWIQWPWTKGEKKRYKVSLYCLCWGTLLTPTTLQHGPFQVIFIGQIYSKIFWTWTNCYLMASLAPYGKFKWVLGWYLIFTIWIGPSLWKKSHTSLSFIKKFNLNNTWRWVLKNIYFQSMEHGEFFFLKASIL
jgi:hypothetical protein